MPSSNNNGVLGLRLTELRTRSSQRKTLRRLALSLCAVMLLVLLLLATGCASHQPIPCEPQPPIPLPVPDRSMPTQTYSAQLAAKLKDWQQKLMAGQSKQ